MKYLLILLFSTTLHAHPLLEDYAFQGHERVLEVGCGRGELTAEIAQDVPDGFVLGIDRDPRIIAVAEQTYDPDLFCNLQFAVASVDALPATSQFDLIVCHQEQLTHDTLSQLARALRPTGQLRICASLLPSWLSEEELSVERLTLQAGLTPLRIKRTSEPLIFSDREALTSWLAQELDKEEAVAEPMVDQLVKEHPEIQVDEGLLLARTIVQIEAYKR